MTENAKPPGTGSALAIKSVVWPTPGETITSLATNNIYTIGDKISEGFFGAVFACVDIWNNALAAKVVKPTGTYEHVRSAAEAELQKLVTLRHPNITYIHDAFEFRDTFYIVTGRCYCPVTTLFSLEKFDGLAWPLPIARCLLQAVHYIHVNGYAHLGIRPADVFAAFAKDELRPREPRAIQFKLGDLGVAKLIDELDVTNTRADWMLPPEAIDAAEYGPIDHRIDIYHVGLLLLQLARSYEIRFTREEILPGHLREPALALPAPYSFALEKTLRRHVQYRTASAMELGRDLHTPADHDE